MLTPSDTDTICAIATPSGRSGVGIVRVSGPLCQDIARSVLSFVPRKRHAHFCNFLDRDGELIDQGITLYFPAPHSFTGEDVLELQGHGGIHVLDCLIREISALGARLARPGEFSERAFLNDKMDLTQAEAIADLIDSSSEQATRSAMRTLQGEFSRLVGVLAESITELRVYVEASIDFSDEEIDFLSEGGVADRLAGIICQLEEVREQARQGAILKEGMSVVIAGRPNAGKSSLLNALAGRDSAIVTEVAGTTRDVLNEQISIDGMPLHVTDTAGLHASEDVVELEGIRRAMLAIETADRILLVIDSTREWIDPQNLPGYLQSIGLSGAEKVMEPQKLTLIQNKIDLSDQDSGVEPGGADAPAVIRLSAHRGEGIDLLRQHLKDCMGFQPAGEGGFIARSRHLEALRQAHDSLLQARYQLDHHQAGELVAEDLRQAHRHLGEITGEFSSDDLLGRIFSSFCIGK